MSDIIRLLPESVANQIAAGEVIQRPASVVKELVENSIDAGATEISIYVKDAGRTSIQINDNGCGMSETDARMAFERHATSKIKEAKDLFAIRSLGFRGEALASIAAIAEVKLKTKRVEDELGNMLDIAAGKITGHEPINCNNGSNFLVKNLFFNTPARRKFLKANNTEFKHIVNEFLRVALARPEIEFKLFHNEVEIYQVPQSNFRQRICNIFGKSINQFLIPVNADTSIVKISGFISKPETAKKSPGDQFMFVNRRFIKHAMMHRAVMKAYEGLMPSEVIPTYFIYFELDPESIDINIHPTKTEVKFEDDQAIFQILQAAVKEALGKFNVVPSIDFENEAAIEIPYLGRDTEVQTPEIQINPFYNPFETEQRVKGNSYSGQNWHTPKADNWEKLYENLRNEENSGSSQQVSVQTSMSMGNGEGTYTNIIQLKNKYILTPVKSGLMMIDQKRAHERILFEEFYEKLHQNQGVSQRSLFPQSLVMSAEHINNLKEILPDLSILGFELEFKSDREIVIMGTPAELPNVDAAILLDDIINSVFTDNVDLKLDYKEQIAKEMAKTAAIPYGKILSQEELKSMVDKLFASSAPNYSPFGKPVISIIPMEDIEKNF